MRPWYEPRKNRPDIPKDAPKKKGIVRFFEALWFEFFELLKLNLLFLASCIPIVTIPAALTALNRITVTMARDENHFLWQDYWKAFRMDFLKSLLGGLILLLLLAAFSISTWFYYMLIAQNRLFVVLAAASACLVLAVLMTGFYFFPMLSVAELTLKQLLKNACILAFLNFKYSLPALLLWGLSTFLGVGLLPYSAPYLALLMFSLNGLMVCFLVYPAIEERVLLQEDRPAGLTDSGTLESASLGDFPDLEDEPLQSAQPEEFPDPEDPQ